MHHLGVDIGVCSAFGFAQAVRLAASFSLLQAWKALGLVEIEVFVCDDPLEAQKVLDTAELSSRVADKPLAAHKQDLAHGEELEPVVQVLGVDADLDGAP